MGTLRPQGIHCTVQGWGSKQWASHVNPTLPYLCQFVFFSPHHPLPLLSATSSPRTAHSFSREALTPILFTVWRSDAVKKEMGGKETERRLSNASMKRHLKARETLPIDWRDIQGKRRQRGRGKRTQKHERRERYKREGSTSLWLSHSAFMFPTGSHFYSAAPGSTDDLILMFHLASAVIHVFLFCFVFFQALKSVRPLEADGAATMADYYTSICFIEASS